MTQTLEHQPNGLYILTPDQQPLAFPLRHTAVQAQIAGNVSRVEVSQRFENPFTTTLEAVYIFPLPDEAAIDEMLIRIGDRTLQGSIKKRQEAQQIYEQAKQQGRTAGLLEQERDNIFTQSLANIRPGEQIEVVIRYSDRLKFAAGNYEFVFPMVVGPRYIPGTPIEPNRVGGSAAAPLTQNQDTDDVADASHLNAPILPAGTRSEQDIQITVDIDAGVPVEQIYSPSHRIQIEREGTLLRVKLAGTDRVPNKDLILRYQVATDRTQATVLTQQDDRGGHFALYLIPALQYASEQVVAKDVVFLIDTSGSQMGAPLMQCQALMRRMIAGLNPHDTFSILDFANTTRQLSPVPLANTRQNRQQAIHYINQLQAGGGTELLHGIRAVLNFPTTDPGRLRSIVLLTDGYIGNENQVLAEVRQQLQPGNRLYSFGAGSSVNRFLLNRLAELGRGMAHIVRQDEPVEPIVEKFCRQINHPVLTNIQLLWEGTGESPLIYPALPPDLFDEQPLVLLGRKPDRHAGRLHITGIAAGGTRYHQTFSLSFDDAGNPALAQLWGRARIKELMNQMVSGDTRMGVDNITETALSYHLLSQYTAFVAVSDDVRVHPAQASVSVQVPVELPDGVSHQGIFGRVFQAMPAPMQAPARRSMRASSPAAPTAAPAAAPVPPSPPQRSATQPPTPRQRDYAPRHPSPGESEWALIDPAAIDSEERTAFHSTNAPMNADFDEDRDEWNRAGGETALPQRLHITKATGLTPQQTHLLSQHLRAVSLPLQVKGELVFELQIHQGRVRQVVLDEQASSIPDATVIAALRRSLLIWRLSDRFTGSVQLVIRVQTA